MSAVSEGKPVYSDGKVHVMKDKCSTCIFRPGNPMTLTPGRVKEMVETSVANGSAITCHKTIHGQAEQKAVCRGFFDSYKEQVPALRLAEAERILRGVDEHG